MGVMRKQAIKGDRLIRELREEMETFSTITSLRTRYVLAVRYTDKDMRRLRNRSELWDEFQFVPADKRSHYYRVVLRQDGRGETVLCDFEFLLAHKYVAKLKKRCGVDLYLIDLEDTAMRITDRANNTTQFGRPLECDCESCQSQGSGSPVQLNVDSGTTAEAFLSQLLNRNNVQAAPGSQHGENTVIDMQSQANQASQHSEWNQPDDDEEQE